VKTVLLTGATGFIGSHLAEALVNQGVRLRALLHDNSRGDLGRLRHLETHLIGEIELISGDLADLDAVNQAVRGCDTVFHLAALNSIPYSYHHPQQVIHTNVAGALNIFLACRDAGVERLVHTSAGEVYGTARAIPISEDHPLQAQSPYAASKIAADKLAESFYCAYGLPVVTMRPFSTFGPRQNNHALIPTLISQVLTLSEIHLGSLDARRDFTYVADTVAGFLKAAQTPGIEGHVFNLGSGREVAVAQLLETILNLAPVFGLRQRPALITNPQHARPERPENCVRLRSDTAHARVELGWQPTISFEDGLRQTMAWVATHLDLYRPIPAEV
jgi:dTDP-glucose 4,6-dehydratase